MTTVISTTGVSRHYGQVRAVDEVTIALSENVIHGLLGRNGAGKTTLMSMLTGQEFPTSGTIEMFGQRPAENAKVLERVCFIKESQKYPDEYRAKHVFRIAPHFFGNWDHDFAAQLISEFRVPLNRQMKKLSRGQLSAVGVIIGLASRAPITFFDEPYLGLDAVARHLFYDHLLADYAEHPRTIVLSTHLIDEVSRLLEHVIVIDEGRIIVDAPAEELRGAATTVTGLRAGVEAFVAGRTVSHRDSIGGLASVTIEGSLDQADRVAAAEAGLELTPVSLQQLIVQKTNSPVHEFEHSA